MNAVEVITASCAVLAAAIALGSAIYFRGRLDGQQKSIDDAVGDLKAQIVRMGEEWDGQATARGAQGVYNENIKAAAALIDSARSSIIKLEARLDGHEAECERRQRSIGERFDRTDRAVGMVDAKIENVSKNWANRAGVIPPNA